MRLRYVKLATISYAALAAVTPLALAAQEVAPQDQAAQDDEVADIVVTGIRSSLQGALNAKRNAPQVLDAISAEDIGKFPDKNIGEALQRVTGVQISDRPGWG